MTPRQKKKITNLAHSQLKRMIQAEINREVLKIIAPEKVFSPHHGYPMVRLRRKSKDSSIT